MPAQLTTRAQVNGYRFLLKRYEHALVRRDIRMLHDPMRTQFRSLIVGAVLGLLGVAGAAILAFLHPQGAVGDSKIVMGKDSGALYVLGDGTLHPVLNLASARLITGDAASPTSVKDSKLTQPRGPLLGIAGAPGALPGSSDTQRSTWTMCDNLTPPSAGPAAIQGPLTTVIAGALDNPAGGAHAVPVRADQALLATHGGKTFLIYDGKRAEIDPGDAVLARSLGPRDQRPRPIGGALLDAIEPVPPLTVPEIDRHGAPGPGRLADIPVGGVIRVHGVDADELYVVLADGVQRVTPFAAGLIRDANSQGMNEITTVPPDRIAGMPVLHRLPIDDFPQQVPAVLTPDVDPVVCLSWTRARDDARATVSVLAGRALPLPSDAEPVVPATADGNGDRIDGVYLRPGTGEFVRSVGAEPGAVSNGPLFFVSDNGIRYGIPDTDTAKVLGLPKLAKPAPKPIVEALSAGPALSRQDALMSHDSLPQCPDSGAGATACARPIPPPGKNN
ncbi:type VII secretion protein EccB [Nocardia spumae]|uniref:type VII secretion protein EccB n=1 Tax=Nocardia spumae TaxID=2887190 RepID=UPI001D14796D|nr:type VII secretion protein EccB [Nocardia spumae]